MMKKNTLLFGLILCLMVGMTAITGCKKDDTAAAGTIKAKVNGANFTSLAMTSTANRVNAGGGRYMITLQGTDQSGKSITFSMNGIQETGTYAIGGGANISIGAAYIEVNTSTFATKTYQAPFDETVAGEVKITEFSETSIKGTFHFTAEDDSGGRATVTEGAFNLNF